MIICTMLLHYTMLKSLPEYSREVYIQSNTNTCRVYSKQSWSVLEKNGKCITISNNVITVQGYYLPDNFKLNKEK